MLVNHPMIGDEEGAARPPSSVAEERNKKKRTRDEREVVDADEAGGIPTAPSPPRLSSLENSLMFRDTSIALQIMHAQFPLIQKAVIRPFVLRSQLYSSVMDRTQVDRDLESLKKEKVIRIFKLSTGQDDHAVMFKEDYFHQMDMAIDCLRVSDHNDLEVFDWFKTHVIDVKLEVGIHHQELCSLLSMGGNLKDGHISLLINAGVLTRQMSDSSMYWFAIPNIGFVLKALSQGRKELLSFLNRKKFKEMSLVSLEKRRLRMSVLDMRFHLRDLIGSGQLKTFKTPIGSIVRISGD